MKSATGEPEAAIGYGDSTPVTRGGQVGCAELVDQVKADFRTTDYYQGAYLIDQAVNDLLTGRRRLLDSVTCYGQVTSISNGLSTGCSGLAMLMPVAVPVMV